MVHVSDATNNSPPPPLPPAVATNNYNVVVTQKKNVSKRKRLKLPQSSADESDNSDDDGGVCNGYTILDSNVPNVPAFTPSQVPGPHVETVVRRSQMKTALEFFNLFFTNELIDKV